MTIKLTPRQRQILAMMNAGEDLAVDGLQVWCGDERTSRAVFNILIAHVLITRDGPSDTYWRINESGKRFLAGETKIYRLASGRFVEDWR